MGVPAHAYWGPPLEQYVLCYTKASIMGRETLEEDIMSSAQECMQTIAAISEEEDQVKSDLLASKVSREMLHSLLLLSLSGHGVIYLAQPSLVRGCIKLMKTIKVDNVISPFSYEYGYLCFNIAKMALGVCLVEKFNSQNITELMERIRSNYKTKDNPSILTELLWELFVQETATPSKGDSRCDWIFGWSDPPVDSGRWHPKLIVTESDALDLLHILCNDRKLFLKSLLAAYTPGASILTLLIWQPTRLQFDLAGRIPLLEPFLDLCWRFSLVATPCDYGFVLRMGHSAMFHYSKLAASAVDAADSRTIINAYIRGIPIIDDTSFYRETATVVYPQLPRFVMCNILPGTEHLFPVLIRTILGRMWEMVLWEDVHHFFSDLDIIISGVDDLLLFLQLHIPPAPVMQLVLEELAEQDLLGLVGFAVNRLDPSRQSNPVVMHYDPTSCAEFRNILLSMLSALSQASAGCNIPSYFGDCEIEWIKHLRHNDTLPFYGR